MLYEKLAVRRKQGIPLFTFWDKKCLRNGQDWENGFLQGLTTSKVIVLLMSKKVLFSSFFLSFFLSFFVELLSLSSFLVTFIIYSPSFVSFQSLEIICTKASSQQDNVLLEYLSSSSFFFFFDCS